MYNILQPHEENVSKAEWIELMQSEMNKVGVSMMERKAHYNL